MYMKKNLLGILLTITILFSCVQPVHAMSENKDISSEVIEISSELLGKSATSDSTTITVKTADESIAQKIHDELISQRAVTLKIKGKKSTTVKYVKKLQKLIGNINKQGVIFQYRFIEMKGNYSIFSISDEHAKLYYYSVKFIEKIDQRNKEELQATCEGYFADINKYKLECEIFPDEQMRKLRVVYDNFVKEITCNSSDCYGYDEPCTCEKLCLDEVDTYNYAMKYLVLKYECDDDRWEEDETYDGTYYIRSFDEFLTMPDIAELTTYVKPLDLMADHNLSKQELMLYENTFSELSEAMKIYAIDYSKYFSCYSYRPEFGMMYDGAGVSVGGYRAVKNLYENKAHGRCSTFAFHESLVFDQLGIKNYINRSSKINHAWSVVKVKNSEEKTLWIPFDYGIGPAEHLAVTPKQSKYIDTDEKKYTLYLSGITGAPSYKNFSDDDFN